MNTLKRTASNSLVSLAGFVSSRNSQALRDETKTAVWETTNPYILAFAGFLTWVRTEDSF